MSFISTFTAICYFAYSYIFDFGPFRVLKNEDHKSVTSLDQLPQILQEDAKADVNSFKSGAKNLTDWLRNWISQKNENMNSMVTRGKNVFATSPKEPPQTSDGSK